MMKMTYNDNDDNDGNNDSGLTVITHQAAQLVVYSIHWNQDFCDNVKYDIHDNNYDDD